MRTTVILPPELLRAAKTRAAKRGETLKTLMTRAVQNELGRRDGVHVQWPLIRSRDKTARRISNADLEELLIADEVRRFRRGSR